MHPTLLRRSGTLDQLLCKTSRRRCRSLPQPRVLSVELF